MYWLITQLYVEIWRKDALSFDLLQMCENTYFYNGNIVDFFIVSLRILFILSMLYLFFLFYLFYFVKIDVFLKVHETAGWELCVRLRLILKDFMYYAICICCSHIWAELWLFTLTLTFPSIHIYLYMHVYLCTHTRALSLGTFQSHFLY